MTHPRLTRAGAAARAAAPVRIVHLGLGNFFRAHPAYYTDRAPDRAEWGIAAFSGRGSALAERMAEQQGIYTLVTRGATDDRFDRMASVTAAHPAAAHDEWLASCRLPGLACITITVTEQGYLSTPEGRLDDANEAVQRDLAALQADLTSRVTTMPARLVAGLAARRAAGGGPLTVVPCDNLPGNGRVIARVVDDLARRLDRSLADWTSATVSFANTMVDRITPRASERDVDLVASGTGWYDACPVVTEPFSVWLIAGSLPAGRPAWDEAGATMDDDIEPHERRKLWLLNGAHSLLAYTGLSRGLQTLAQAAADDACRTWMNRWWTEAGASLPQPPDEVRSYCDRLRARFDNARIDYPLRQIAADGSVKLPVRIVAVLRSERAAGRLPEAAVTAIAAWIAYLDQAGPEVQDPHAATLVRLVSGQRADRVEAVLNVIAPDLVDDATLVSSLCEAVGFWSNARS